MEPQHDHIPPALPLVDLKLAFGLDVLIRNT